MAASSGAVLQQATSFVAKLSASQRITLGLVVIAVITGIFVLVSVVNRPSYGTLFSNLNEQDASKIVEKLKEKSVQYTLDDGGKTILVPKQQIYDLRLSLAGEGLPQSSIIGYELFDKTNLGVSDFVQRINYRRALEGELARTILQLDEVEGARVHLVVPEKALFKEDEKPATASVVLKLKTGKPLKQEVVKGIAHLLASSIEGLDAGNVTIVDSKGVLLSDNKSTGLAATTSTQYELQQKVETYLSQKAQSLLESVVGAGNALVQVTADLDFRQVERTLEEYDPDKTAIQSEQTQEEKSASTDSSTPSTRTSSLTNYEVNKTVEHIVENLGNIKRLSIAAVVNGVPKVVEKDGQKTTEMTPRNPDEMVKLTDLVKRSVGFDQQRNDEVSVTNLTFGENGVEQDFMFKQSPGFDWTVWGSRGLLFAAMVGGIVLLRSILNRMKFRMPAMVVDSPMSEATALLKEKHAAEIPPVEEEISEAAILRSQRRERVNSYIQEKPGETSRLLKVWLAED